MKLLYLVYFDINLPQMAGVKKKILSQLNAFDDLGINSELMYREGNKLLIQKNGKIKKKFEIKKGLSRYKRSIYKVFKMEAISSNYDYVYIRFPNTIDFSVLSLFKCVGKDKVILEVPTYTIKGEFDEQLKDLKNKKLYIEYILKNVLFMTHNLLSRNLNQYVNRIVTYMPYDSIWGVKTIPIDNGVDVTKYLPLTNKIHDSSTFVLTGVANVSKWHGFDRVIYGIKEYTDDIKNNKKIIFNIVGDGPEISNLKNLVKLNNLENHVIFHGPKFNEQLISIYNKTDVAISSIGMHRIGLIEGSTIKTKEYCSLGLPFVYAYKETKISDTFGYALQVDANENPIDIELLIKFYNNLKINENYEEKMHDFAVENYTWVSQMKRVIELMKVEKLNA